MKSLATWWIRMDSDVILRSDSMKFLKNLNVSTNAKKSVLNLYYVFILIETAYINLNQISYHCIGFRQMWSHLIRLLRLIRLQGFHDINQWSELKQKKKSSSINLDCMQNTNYKKSNIFMCAIYVYYLCVLFMYTIYAYYLCILFICTIYLYYLSILFQHDQISYHLNSKLFVDLQKRAISKIRNLAWVKLGLVALRNFWVNPNFCHFLSIRLGVFW